MNEIMKKAIEWTKEPFDKETRDEIQKLVDTNNTKELTDRFYKDLDFGTGGLRGIMGAGSNRVNEYTIGMATQGLAKYLNKYSQNASVAIAHDSRINSKEFAKYAASVFAGNGIKAYIFDSLKPTPLLSYAVRYLKTTAGINITASHNPKEYNGYKVYFEDGCQVLPPHDEGIITEVRLVKSPNDVNKLDFDEAKKQNLINDIPLELEKNFISTIKDLSLNPEIIKKNGNDLKIIYTPLHGAGYKLVPDILNELGFNDVTLVKEQQEPDGNFPTVQSPNPEEKDALARAINLASNLNADIVLATDPDCDRIGIAVKDTDEYVLFNGNETGIVIANYMLSKLKEKNKLDENSYIVKTIVTTDSIHSIAENYNVKVFDTLTGFKYIGEIIEKNIDKRKFIMGFEESYGYLTGDFIRDKCGVSAAAMICEVALDCKMKNISLIDYINQIFTKYGFRKESLKSFTLKGAEGNEKIQKIMLKLRETPPKEIAKIKVLKIRDCLTSEIRGENKVIEKIDLPKSNVLTFFLEDGTTITARPSGTEPKIKFYFSVKESKSNEKSLDTIKKEVLEKTNLLIQHVEEWVN